MLPNFSSAENIYIANKNEKIEYGFKHLLLNNLPKNDDTDKMARKEEL